MHNAPAVSYPVGRSRFQGWLLSILSLLGLVATIVWFTQADSVGWRQWLMLSGATLTMFGAWWQWQHAVTGQLAWDGLAWTWTEPQANLTIQVTLIADAQRAMLLLLTGLEQGVRRWIWVDREFSVTLWLPLRRAVHQHPRRDVDPLADARQPGAVRQ